MTSTGPVAPPTPPPLPPPASMIGKDSAVEQAGRSPGKAVDAANRPRASAATSLEAARRAVELGPAKPVVADRHGDRDNDRSGPTDRAAVAGVAHVEWCRAAACSVREETGERPAPLAEPHSKANHVQQQQEQQRQKQCEEWEHCLGALTVPSRGRRRSRGGRSHRERLLTRLSPAPPDPDLATPGPAAHRVAWSPGRSPPSSAARGKRWPGAAHEAPPPPHGTSGAHGGVGRRRRHYCRDGEDKLKKPGKYACSYCGRACAKPSVLKKHVRMHTGERPYPCLACGFSFKTKSNLYKHCKSHAHAVRAAPLWPAGESGKGLGLGADSEDPPGGPSDGERTDTDVECCADERAPRDIDASAGGAFKARQEIWRSPRAAPALFGEEGEVKEEAPSRCFANKGVLDTRSKEFFPREMMGKGNDVGEGEVTPGLAASALPQVVVVRAGQGGRAITESGQRSTDVQQQAPTAAAAASDNDLRSAKHRLWRKRELESNSSGHLLTPSPFSSKGSTDSGYFSRSGSTELSLASPLAPIVATGTSGGGGGYNAPSFAFQGSAGRGRAAERYARTGWCGETVEDDEEDVEGGPADARTWSDPALSRRGGGAGAGSGTSAQGPHPCHDSGRRRSSSADPPVSVVFSGAKCQSGEFLDVPVFETGGFFRSNSMPTCNPSRSGHSSAGHPAGASLSFDECFPRKGGSIAGSSPVLAYGTNPRPLVRQQAVELPACRDIQGRQCHEQTKVTSVIWQSSGNLLSETVVPLENKTAVAPSCQGSGVNVSVNRTERDVVTARLPHCPGALDRTSLQGKRRKPKSIRDEDEPDFVRGETSVSGGGEPVQEPPMDVTGVGVGPTAMLRWHERTPFAERESPAGAIAVTPSESPANAAARFAPRRGQSLESVVGRHAGNNEISVIQHTKLLGRPHSFEKSDAGRSGCVVLRQSLSADRARDGITVQQNFPATADSEKDDGGAKVRGGAQPDPQAPRNGRLIRQSKIPEILVTVEPDGDQQQNDYLGEEPGKKREEEFQWPRRSETLEKLPAEKLPPKKKRLRLCELGNASVESSNDSSVSAPLSRSPSADGTLSRCSSLSSASLDHAEGGDDEKPKKEPAEKSGEEGAALFLTVPGAPPRSPLQPPGRGMRRAASEHGPCGAGPGPQAGRSRSFDDGILSAPCVPVAASLGRAAAAGGRRKAYLEHLASLNGHPEAARAAASAMAVDGYLHLHSAKEYSKLMESCGASPADVQQQPQHQVFRREIPQRIGVYALSSERPGSQPYLPEHALTVQRLDSELHRPNLQWAPHHASVPPPFPPLPLSHRPHTQNNLLPCHQQKQHFPRHAFQNPFERFHSESSSRPPARQAQAVQQAVPSPVADARSMGAMSKQWRSTPVDVGLKNHRSSNPQHMPSTNTTAQHVAHAALPRADVGAALRTCGRMLQPSPLASAVPVRRPFVLEPHPGHAIFTSPSQLAHPHLCQPAVVVCHVTGEEGGAALMGSSDEAPQRSARAAKPPPPPLPRGEASHLGVSASVLQRDQCAARLGDVMQAAPSGCRLPPGASSRLGPDEGEDRPRGAADPSSRQGTNGEARKQAEPPRLRKPVLVRQFCTTEPVERDGSPAHCDAAVSGLLPAAPGTRLGGVQGAPADDVRTSELPSQEPDGHGLTETTAAPSAPQGLATTKSAVQVRVLLPAGAAAHGGTGSITVPVLQAVATPSLLVHVGPRPGLAVLVADLAEVQQLILPGLRTLTPASWCILNARARPSTVAAADTAAAAADGKASVYGPWEPAKSGGSPCGGILPGVSTHAALALLRSRQRTGPSTYSTAAACPDSACALVHSGWWRRPHAAQPIPAVKVCAPLGKPAATVVGSHEKELERERARENARESVRERSAKGHHDSPSRAAKPALPCRIKIFDGGYKSNEEYVYVRGRGRGKYVCEECGIRCKKPSMLRKHIRSHSDLRPYRCHICSFAFKTKGNLTKHVKSKAHSKKCLEMGISAMMGDDPGEQDPEWQPSPGARADHQFSDADDSDRDRDDDDDDEDDEDDNDEGLAALAALTSDGNLRSASPLGRWQPRGTGERGARSAGGWPSAADAAFDDEVARLTLRLRAPPHGAASISAAHPLPRTCLSPPPRHDAAPALAVTPGGSSPSQSSRALPGRSLAGGGTRSPPYDARPGKGVPLAPSPNRLGVLLERAMRDRPRLAGGCSLSPSRPRAVPRDGSPSPGRHGAFRTHSLSPYRRDVARDGPPSPGGAGRTHSLSPRRGGAARLTDDPAVVAAAPPPPATGRSPPALAARGAGGGRVAPPRPQQSPLADAARCGLTASARHSGSLSGDPPGSKGRGSSCEEQAAQCYADVGPTSGNVVRAQPPDDRPFGATPGGPARPFPSEPRQLPTRHLQLPKALPHAVAVVGSVHMIDMSRVARAAGSASSFSSFSSSSLDEEAAVAFAPERLAEPSFAGAPRRPRRGTPPSVAVLATTPVCPDPFAFDSGDAAVRFRAEPPEFRAAAAAAARSGGTTTTGRGGGDPCELAPLPLSVACAVVEAAPPRSRRPEEGGMHGSARRPLPVSAGVSETAATT